MTRFVRLFFYIIHKITATIEMTIFVCYVFENDLYFVGNVTPKERQITVLAEKQ
jgi:hypothetical protein